MDNLPNIYTSEFSLETSRKIEDRLFAYSQGFSENTNRARTSDFRIYKDWCDKRDLKVTPAHPENIELFLWDMASKPRLDKNGGMIRNKKTGRPLISQRKSTSTVERYLSTIKYIHDISHEVIQDISGDYSNDIKHKNPADTKRVRIALKAIKRRFRAKGQRQAEPIRLNLINAVFETLTDSLRDTLTKTLMSVGFDSMLRCSELARIELDHLNYHDDGSGSVYVGWHKSDQKAEGGYRYLSAVSIKLIHEWCHKAGIDDGLLFRSISKHNTLLPAMCKDRIAKIYKLAAKRCGIESAGISSHSTRVGAAQELLENGVSMPALMVAGDWKSPSMPVRYAKKINVASGAMADLAKSQGRS
jgi:integrase